MNVVGGELSDGLFLLDVDEADFLSGDRRIELVVGDLLTLWANEESGLGVGSFFLVVREQGPCAKGAAGDFKMIPRLIGHVEGDGFAGERIAVPIGQFEIVVAADEARAVEDAGPCCFANAVGGAPPPAIEIEDVVNLDLADGCVLLVEQNRIVTGAIPAVLQIPLLLPVCSVA